MNNQNFNQIFNQLEHNLSEIKNKSQEIPRKNVFEAFESIQNKKDLLEYKKANISTSFSQLGGSQFYNEFKKGNLEYHQILQKVIAQRGSIDVITDQVEALIDDLEKFQGSDDHIAGELIVFQKKHENRYNIEEELHYRLKELKFELIITGALSFSTYHFVTNTLAIKSIDNLAELGLYGLAITGSLGLSYLLIISILNSTKLSFEVHKDKQELKRVLIQDKAFLKRIMQIKADYNISNIL
jgi:hypothetical protein